MKHMYFAIKTTVRVGAGRDWVVEEGGGLAVPGFINSYHCRGHGPVPGRPGSTEGTLGGAPAGAAGGFPPPTRPAGGARGPGTAAPALFKCFSAVRSPWRPGCGGLWRGNRRRRGWRGTWRGRGVRPAGDQRGVSRCMLHFPGPAGWTKAGVLTMAVPGFDDSHCHTGHGPVPGRPGWIEGTPGRAPAGSAGVFRP